MKESDAMQITEKRLAMMAIDRHDFFAIAVDIDGGHILVSSSCTTSGATIEFIDLAMGSILAKEIGFQINEGDWRFQVDKIKFKPSARKERDIAKSWVDQDFHFLIYCLDDDREELSCWSTHPEWNKRLALMELVKPALTSANLAGFDWPYADKISNLKH